MQGMSNMTRDMYDAALQLRRESKDHRIGSIDTGATTSKMCLIVVKRCISLRITVFIANARTGAALLLGLLAKLSTT